jgi:hypothetical protein
MPALQLEGKIREHNLPLILHTLYAERERGVLTLSDGDVVKKLAIKEGKILTVSSNQLDDRLDQHLLREGLVGLKPILMAERDSRRQKRRLGEVLVELGLMRQKDMVRAVIDQMREILFSLFQWTRGDYCFESRSTPAGEEMITLDMSTGNVLLGGIRRIRSWYRVREAIGGLDARYRVTPRLEEVTRDMDLSVAEWSFLALFESDVSLEQVCEASPIKDFEITHLIWAFLVLGALARVGE